MITVCKHNFYFETTTEAGSGWRTAGRQFESHVLRNAMIAATLRIAGDCFALKSLLLNMIILLLIVEVVFSDYLLFEM